MKKLIIAIVVVGVLAVGGYFFYQQSGTSLQGNFGKDLKEGLDPISVNGQSDIQKDSKNWVNNPGSETKGSSSSTTSTTSTSTSTSTTPTK